ncbi:MAG: YdcF family protein [Bacteroidia bacterium]
MFFILSKILSFIIHPVTWIFVLLLFTVFAKKEKRKKWAIISLVVFYIFSNEFLFCEVMRSWEEPRKKMDDLGVYDIVIVLGGMITFDSDFERMQANRGIDRSLQGLLVYKKGKAKKLFISGGSGSLQFPDMKEAIILKNYLTQIGIPEQDILIESESKNTYENAVYTRKELERLGLHHSKLLLVTSASHMYRAKKCFEKQGLMVDTYSADVVAGPRKFVFDHVFLPNGNTLNDWYNLLHELLGVVIYKIMGYI